MKELITKLIIAMVVAWGACALGLPSKLDVLSTLLTAYSVIFSVFVSFATSFNLREVRNSQVRHNVLRVVTNMTKWAIIDFIYTTVLYALCAESPISFPYIKIPMLLKILVLINMISVAIAFSTLRRLRNKIEEQLQKEDNQK